MSIIENGNDAGLDDASGIAATADSACTAIAELMAELEQFGMLGIDVPAAEWVDAVRAVERVGRLVDAARVRVAAAAHAPARIVPAVAVELGARQGADVLAGTAGVSTTEARRRIQVAGATCSQLTLAGGDIPPRREQLAHALTTGRIDVGSAASIVRELDRVQPRAAAEDLDAAEAELVAYATGAHNGGRSRGVAPMTEFVTDTARLWAAAIDPDGARPMEERMLRGRELRIGREDADGLLPVRGRFERETGLLLQGLIDAHTASANLTERVPGEDRSRAQRAHDAFAAIIRGAARQAEAPTTGGTTPQVLAIVTVAELADPDGRAGDAIGQVVGSPTPASRTSIERMIDTNGFQPILITQDGAIAGIGSPQRCFTPAQRRALIARDRGCVIPGCRIPAGWCEAHHVTPWREGGPTHTDNGALLCWWHHVRIDTGPWHLQMTNGIPHVRGPGIPEWTPCRQFTPQQPK